jgi:cell division protein FtsB
MPPTDDHTGRPLLTPRRSDSPWLRRVLLFVTCVLLADALIGDRGLAATIRARREHAAASAALRQLRIENAALRHQQRRLREDARAIEAAAREDLGLIRPGEILVVVTSPR